MEGGDEAWVHWTNLLVLLTLYGPGIMNSPLQSGLIP